MLLWRRYVAYIQCFLLVIFAVNPVWSASSAPQTPRAPEQLELFASTEPIQTDAGPVHVEVQTFNIQNEHDLRAAREIIVENLRFNPKTNELFKLDVKTSDYRKTNLEILTQAVVGEAENLVAAYSKLEPKEVVVEPPVEQPGFFKRNYNLTLGFVRFVANTGTVSMGLITGKGVSVEHAIMIGMLAGAISGGIQIKSDQVFKWLSNSIYLVNSAKRLKLLPENSGLSISRSEKILKEVEMYGKWALLETGFLLVCNTAMMLMNIPVAENVFVTVGKSTLSQGIFEVGVLKAAAQLEKMNPSWAGKVAVFKNVSIFAGSSLSVLAAIGSMVGIPYANLGFVALTATGLVFNFSSKILLTESAQKILSRWKPKASSAKLTCRGLMMSLQY